MAKAEIHEVVQADREKLYQAISRYEDYPKFVDNCKSAKVERKGTGKARVAYHVELIKDVNYTLDHSEDPQAGVVSWTLVDSDTFKVNNGKWILTSAGPGKTDVKYELEVEFKIYVPGMILNKLIKGPLPSMVKSFVDRANSL
jgi:ribosome-associated toxin RatA of RatAB toxin-antitoxin module